MEEEEVRRRRPIHPRLHLFSHSFIQVVTVLEAEDLPWIDLFSPANGYVRAFVGGGRAARTRVVPNSSNPVWN